MFKRTENKPRQKNKKLNNADSRKRSCNRKFTLTHFFLTKAVGGHSVCPCSPLFEDAPETPKRFSRIISQSISLCFDPNCSTSRQSSLLGPSEMLECEGTLAYQDFVLKRLSSCMVHPTMRCASSLLPYPLQRAALAASLSR